MTSRRDPEDGNGHTPQHLGSFQIVHQLGRGGMGEVFLAYDQRLQRHVAIKRVSGQGAIGPDHRQRFLREARVAAKLNHPGIVQIHDIFEEASTFHIVMEYIEGYSIAQLLREGPLPWEKVAVLGKEIAQALEAAHQQGIIHRDLKAENVMFTKTGHIKILDFGLAKHQAHSDESLTATGQLLGTYRVMSPEQARGEPLTHRTDLYSLGVLLYEMLSGGSPFVGENLLQTLHMTQHHQQTPLHQLNPEIPSELSDLVDWLLRKAPQDRPFNAGQVASILDHLTPSNGQSGIGSSSKNTSTFSSSFTSAVTQAPAQPKASTKRFWPYLLLAAIVILVTAVWWLFQAGAAPWRPIRVAILQPENTGANQVAPLLAQSIQESILRTATTLEGLSPLEPSSIGGQGDTPQEIALATGADEVLVTRMQVDGFFLRITLRRLLGTDGSVMDTKTFEVPANTGELLIAADAVSAKIRALYQGMRTRPGTLAMKVRDEDYAEYLKVVQELMTSSEIFDASREAQLAGIMAGSPQFLPAYTLACGNLLVRFDNTGDQNYLVRAEALCERVARLAPKDIRVLEMQFGVALARGDFGKAELVVTELERTAPGSVHTLTLRARMMETQSDMPGAIAVLRDAVTRRPNWRSLYRLANLEIQAGEIDSARKHLEKLLEIAPDNIWGLASLAGAELVHGDLARAEVLFADAARLLPHKSFFANLGTARYYQGKYGQAAQAYRDAIAKEPNDPSLHLGLADALLAQGETVVAKDHYQTALKKLNALADEAELDPIQSIVKAQCLAHLGRLEAAVAVTLKTLQEHPDHGEVAFQAAVVYVLAGEKRSVLACTETALAKGIQPRWFHSPMFDAIQDDPRFRQILATGSKTKGK